MTSLTLNDATGQPMATEDSVKVSVFIRSHKAHKDFDCSMKEIKSLLGLKGIKKLPFYKLEKVDGKWERLSIDDQMQEKID